MHFIGSLYPEVHSSTPAFLNYIGGTLLGILSTSVAEELDCLSRIFTMAVYTQLLLHDTQDTNLYNMMINLMHKIVAYTCKTPNQQFDYLFGTNRVGLLRSMHTICNGLVPAYSYCLI